jgi:hypothetical protein
MRNIYVPQTLYKFMDPYYLKILEKEKKFFINHLNNYKEKELGTEVGDDNEGTLTSVLNIYDYTFGSGKNIALDNSFNNIQNMIQTNGVKITMKNISLQTTYSDQNYFVFCTCLEYDEKVKKEFGGSTLIINDVPKFLNYLNRKLLKQGKQLVIAEKCRYVKDRKNFFNDMQNSFFMDFPALVKELRYSYQKEFRILWRNIDGSQITKPIKIYSPEALQQCTFQY